MIGLDTNVFLRLFVEDNQDQTTRARRFVATAIREEGCFVNAVVLAEFVWTLARRMKRSKPEIVRLLAQALSADDVEIQHAKCAHRALDDYRNGAADFADYFLAEINKESGCSSTATFDRHALGSPNFSPVP